MAKYSKLIKSQAVQVPVCEALGIDPQQVRRIVLDLTVDSVVTAYVEMYGDERMLNIDWAPLGGAVTVTLEETEESIQ